MEQQLQSKYIWVGMFISDLNITPHTFFLHVHVSTIFELLKQDYWILSFVCRQIIQSDL